MRTLCKKALALCLVFALALTCFVGTLSVSAADVSFNANVSVTASPVTLGESDTASAVFHFELEDKTTGINEALIKVSSKIGSVVGLAELVKADGSSYTQDELNQLDYAINYVTTDGQDIAADFSNIANLGAFFLSAKTAESAIKEAFIKVTFSVDANVTAGPYEINIDAPEGKVMAASPSEDIINLIYAGANFTVTEPVAPHVHTPEYVSNDNGTHNYICTAIDCEGFEEAIYNQDCVDVDANGVCDDCPYVFPVEEVSPIEVRLISGSTVKGVLSVDTIDEALELATYYASNKYEGSWVDPTIALNQDLVLTSDIYVSMYTTLDLGDYAVTGDYDICFANDGIVKANYELTEIAANPLIKATVEDGVYTYTSKLKLNIASRNLNLGDKINIIFTGNATEDGSADITYSLKYYQDDGNVNYTIIDEVESSSLSGTSRTIKFLTEGIVAQKMGVLINGTICAKTTVGDVDYYVYSETREYSVRHYANNIYPSTSDAKLKKLLATMLNYGASAQLAFDFNTDDLVNNVDYLTETDRQLPDIDWSTDEKYLLAAKSVNNLKDYIDDLSIAYRKSCSLELTDGADIKFTITNVSSEHTYKLAVWSYNEYNALLEQVNGDLDEVEKLLTLENCNKVVDFGSAVADGNKFKATASFTGIPVKKFSDTYVFRPVEVAADGSCAYDYSFSYSVTQYCTNIINSDAATYYDICKRIAVYADAARDFYDGGYIVDSEG